MKLRQEAKLDQALSRTANAIERTMTQQAHKLERLADSLNEATRSRLTQESHRLEMLQQRTHALNPQTQLNRGYSITLHEGKAVYDTASLKQGDKLTTRLAKGTVSSTVD